MMRFEIHTRVDIQEEKSLKGLEDALVLNFYLCEERVEPYIDGVKQSFRIVDRNLTQILNIEHKPCIEEAEVWWDEIDPYRVHYTTAAGSFTEACNCIRQATNRLAGVLMDEWVSNHKWPTDFRIENILENTLIPLEITITLQEGQPSQKLQFEVLTVSRVEEIQ